MGYPIQKICYTALVFPMHVSIKNAEIKAIDECEKCLPVSVLVKTIE